MPSGGRPPHQIRTTSKRRNLVQMSAPARPGLPLDRTLVAANGKGWRYYRRTRRSAVGRVSRTHCLSTSVRNCTRDEGGPFEAGSQVQVSSHRKLLSSRATVVLCQEGARAPCCTRDEGGPFGAVLQGRVSNRHEL